MHIVPMSQRPSAFHKAKTPREPLRSLNEMSELLGIASHVLSLAMANAAKQGQTLPEAFKPKARSQSYYKVSEFKRWYSSLNKEEN